MYRYLTIAPWPVVAMALALSAMHTHAQERPAVQPSPPAPTSATSADARVPETKYDSAFTGYQLFREQKLAPWRELNDEAHKAGGHIGTFGDARGTTTTYPPEHKK